MLRLGKKFTAKRPGQVYFLSLVIISAMVFMGFFLGGFVVNRLRLASLVGPSTQAFFAADTGVEAMLYYFFHQGPVPGDGINDCVDMQLTGNFKCVIPTTTPQVSYWVVEACDLFTDPNCSNMYYFDSYGQQQEVLRVFQARPF